MKPTKKGLTKLERGIDSLSKSYYEAYAKVKQAERELSSMSELIKVEMKKVKLEEKSTEYGKFKFYLSTHYEYSEKVAKLKAKEVAEGIATAKKSEVLRFTPFIKI